MRRLAALRVGLQDYDEALAADDRAAIIGLVERLLDDGLAPLDILTGVVAPAQRAIGERWQRGEWSVAQEHAATAMAMVTTETIVGRLAGTPVTAGHVIVTCAEREWHWLPAAIISCALRADGWRTTQLGPATSPLRLSQYLQNHGPDAVAVSCSVLGALPTTRRFIEAATAAGVPVIVGGAAFGSDNFRAVALGATAWAPDAGAACDIAAALPTVVPAAPALPRQPAAEQRAVESDQPRLVERIQRQWTVTANSAVDPAETSLRTVAREALPQPLHAVSAALLTGDVRPLSETAAWLADLLTSRGVDAGPAVDELATVLSAALVDHPLSVDLVRRHFRLDR
ncbi:cobalamin B12-binding domain-containing protein [Mycolicibacterium thermoresistibile]